jgi:hypothetical protein
LEVLKSAAWRFLAVTLTTEKKKDKKETVVRVHRVSLKRL